MRAPLRFASAAALIACCSCDLLRPAPFSIAGWAPGEGRFGPEDDIRVRVSFSEDPDRPSVENAFSITEDGVAVVGTFEWDGPTMSFSPVASPRGRSAYRVTVGAEAMSLRGVSLERALEARFSTRLEDCRPRLLSTSPPSGGILDQSLGSLSLSFSEPIEEAGFRSCLSLSPSTRGYWKLEPGGATAAFAPSSPWEWGAEYEVSISADLRDESGNRLGEATSFRFHVGEDRIPPVIVGADALDRSGGLASSLAPDDPADSTVTENALWESGWRLRLRFSEPVRLWTLASRVSCDGGPPLELETAGDCSDVAVFAFVEPPAWGGRFAVRVRGGFEDARGNEADGGASYRILADGPGSRPPRFVGVRLPLAPGESDPADRDLAAFALDSPYETLLVSGDDGRYPVGEAVPTSIELYLELAAGGGLDILALMSSFRLSSTNGALDFSARRVSLGGFDYASPYGPWEGFAVARVDGILTNRVEPGVVSIELAAGLRDSEGNASPSAQRLELLK
ncbi:MAG: Ig-like domain-containing protein [Spirochaetes bacterium]|nr:Ig-like domain-containing protein [Spirochaetota bacterium]MBU1078878.1 Ig-like domain-containing protein [Spirochaetota bacterium]